MLIDTYDLKCRVQKHFSTLAKTIDNSYPDYSNRALRALTRLEKEQLRYLSAIDELESLAREFESTQGS